MNRREKKKAVPEAKKGRATDAVRASHAASLHMEGLGLIESVLGRGTRPILGLYLYTAVAKMLADIRRSPEYRKIRPHLIGTPAILLARPLISQTELARYLGCGRATAGKQVAACVRDGWVTRKRSLEDRRTYLLELTALGRSKLEEVAAVVAVHEAEMCKGISAYEQAELKALLSKFISG